MRRHFVHKPSPAYPRSCFAGLQSAFCGTQIGENFSGGALIGQSPLFVDKPSLANIQSLVPNPKYP